MARPSLAAHRSSGTFQRGFSCFVLKLGDALFHPDGLCLQWGGRPKRGRRFLRVPGNVQPGGWSVERADMNLRQMFRRDTFVFSCCEIKKLQILRELRDKKQPPFKKLEMAVLSHILFLSPLLPPSALQTKCVQMQTMAGSIAITSVRHSPKCFGFNSILQVAL